MVQIYSWSYKRATTTTRTTTMNNDDDVYLGLGVEDRRFRCLALSFGLIWLCTTNDEAFVLVSIDRWEREKKNYTTHKVWINRPTDWRSSVRSQSTTKRQICYCFLWLWMHGMENKTNFCDETKQNVHHVKQLTKSFGKFSFTLSTSFTATWSEI